MTSYELTQARKALGLTQAELAAMLGMGAQTRISKMENGGTITEPTRRLVQAYLDGYRPADWPQSLAG